MKRSQQRELVLEAVTQAGGHPSADEIFQHIRRQLPTISLATVYRNLGLLCSMGQIMKVSLPQGGDRYDRNPRPHHHLLCRMCAQVQDVPLDYDDGLDRAIAELTGHDVSGHTIQFYGTCKACRESSLPSGENPVEIQ